MNISARTFSRAERWRFIRNKLLVTPRLSKTWDVLINEYIHILGSRS